jgi:crotonobetainyl-CoA:carnitine CoA-transferase CaiB-like acyl-CoA transferase
MSSMMTQPHRPLANIRVVDLSQGLAGPTCGFHLAEFGAQVVKVEPPEGDWGRNMGTPVAGMSPMAHCYNRGKQGLAIDLKAPEGKEAVLRLARVSDVFIQSARPGAMQRLGLDFEAIAKVKSNIVYVSVSGYGQTGPDRSLPMTDTVAQAFSGLMSINKGRDGVPHKIDTTIVDNVTGLYAFQAAAMALWGRGPDTPATHLDISLMQGAASVQAHRVLEYSATRRMPEALNPPAGSFPTKDGWIAVTLVTEEQYQRICATIGMDHLATDPRFRTFADRRVNISALMPLLDARFREMTTADWETRLKAADILSSPVNDYGSWLTAPQVVTTQAAPAITVSGPGAAGGTQVQIPRTPGQPLYDAPAPHIGQHSRQILAEVGFSPSEIDALIAKGTVAQFTTS